MEVFGKTIGRIINTIQWKKIKGYHKKLNILWEFTYDKEIIQRIPSISELKDELRSIFKHMIDENLNYISYGNWIIFWDKETGEVGDIRVIFRLADFQFEENPSNNKETLEKALKEAIENEDYEYAAVIRDTLQKK